MTTQGSRQNILVVMSPSFIFNLDFHVWIFSIIYNIGSFLKIYEGQYCKQHLFPTAVKSISQNIVASKSHA